jgi:hypothetical protein
VRTKLHGVTSQKTVIFSKGMEVQLSGNGTINNKCVNDVTNGWN